MNDLSAKRSVAEAMFAMPTIDHSIRCCRAAAFTFCVFVIVFAGADYITSLREHRFRIDFAFEQNLPFIPELTLVYSSLYLMFLTVPFVLLTDHEIRRFVVLMTTITIVAGVCFMLLPAELQFVTPRDTGRASTMFAIADAMNLTYNLCPSLHVAYAVVCAEAIRRKWPERGWPFHLWALAIAVSAWLTYQHHLVDLIAGYALSLIAFVLFTRYFPKFGFLTPTVPAPRCHAHRLGGSRGLDT